MNSICYANQELLCLFVSTELWLNHEETTEQIARLGSNLERRY